MEITIRNCNLSDLNIAFDLLYKAAVWLKGKTIDYWQVWLNPPDIYVAWIKQGFDNGEFYFVYSAGNLVGMYRLQCSDEIFWGKRNDKAGYIHSFTTNRELKGKGLGYAILSTIEKELHIKGFDYFRLDCSPDIDGLCKYYEDYGFKPRGIVFVHEENVQLYEKKIG